MFVKDDNTLALFHFNKELNIFTHPVTDQSSIKDDCNNEWNLEGDKKLEFTNDYPVMGPCVHISKNTYLTFDIGTVLSSNWTIECRFMLDDNDMKENFYPNDNLETVTNATHRPTLFQAYVNNTTTAQDKNLYWLTASLQQKTNEDNNADYTVCYPMMTRYTDICAPIADLDPLDNICPYSVNHIAIVSDSSVPSIAFYLNGVCMYRYVLASKKTFVPNSTTISYGKITIGFAGSTYTDDTFDKFGFSGYINEFRISNIARYKTFTTDTVNKTSEMDYKFYEDSSTKNYFRLITTNTTSYTYALDKSGNYSNLIKSTIPQIKESLALIKTAQPLYFYYSDNIDIENDEIEKSLGKHLFYPDEHISKIKRTKTVPTKFDTKTPANTNIKLYQYCTDDAVYKDSDIKIYTNANKITMPYYYYYLNNIGEENSNNLSEFKSTKLKHPSLITKRVNVKRKDYVIDTLTEYRVFNAFPVAEYTTAKPWYKKTGTGSITNYYDNYSILEYNINNTHIPYYYYYLNNVDPLGGDTDKLVNTLLKHPKNITKRVNVKRKDYVIDTFTEYRVFNAFPVAEYTTAKPRYKKTGTDSTTNYYDNYSILEYSINNTHIPYYYYYLNNVDTMGGDTDKLVNSLLKHPKNITQRKSVKKKTTLPANAIRYRTDYYYNDTYEYRTFNAFPVLEYTPVVNVKVTYGPKDDTYTLTHHKYYSILEYSINNTHIPYYYYYLNDVDPMGGDTDILIIKTNEGLDLDDYDGKYVAFIYI